MTQKVHVESLQGRRVYDSEDKLAGRIASIHATWKGENCFVEEYRLGAAAFLERLGIYTGRLVGWMGSREPLRVPWNQLDLSDPENPRLKCTIDELRKLAR
jgi:hypothetical protein